MSSRAHGTETNWRANPINGLFRNIHTTVLTIAFAAVLVAIAATGSTAQVTQLLFEDRAADTKEGSLFEAKGRFEIRWTATGGQFLVKLIDQNGIELISSAPQTREGDEAAPMTGKLPFAGPGTFKAVTQASGPWHVRIVSFE